MPMMYFVTKGVNPTPYPFLFPGMMTETDEATVLARLKQGSPEYVMMCLVEAEQLLRMWPSIDVNRIRMNGVEGWIQEHYVVDESSLEIDGYKLYRRRNNAQ